MRHIATPKVRQAWNLREEGKSYRKIAAIMGVTVEAVSSYIQRGRSIWAPETFEEDGPPEPRETCKRCGLSLPHECLTPESVMVQGPSPLAQLAEEHGLGTIGIMHGITMEKYRAKYGKKR